MKTLPDPRAYTPISSNPLVLAAERSANPGSALQQEDAGGMLLSRFRKALEVGDDARIEQAFAEATSQSVRETLTRALGSALEARDEAALVMRVFAIPLLIVTGGRSLAVVPGVVPDVGELRKLFEKQGALGRSKNFGLGNALTTAEKLAAVKPSMLYRLARGSGQEGFRPPDLAPQDIEVDSGEECVHLRFLVGAAVAPANAPGFTETAGNIGAWGLPFTQALAAQLGQQGLSLLPIPRPPMNLQRALETGRFALREMEFQLFLGNALRRFRARVGDPDATVASYSDGSVRISLGSPFDASLACEYRWPLYPEDDLGAVGTSIFGLLADCRVETVQVAETVWLAKAASH
ncbi:MAG TPA: hypothetical protein VE030_04125 [Burkholderiales bacterium]|nr:hypothetical protein [Burkholderiales bacterium]